MTAENTVYNSTGSSGTTSWTLLTANLIGWCASERFLPGPGCTSPPSEPSLSQEQHCRSTRTPKCCSSCRDDPADTKVIQMSTEMKHETSPGITSCFTPSKNTSFMNKLLRFIFNMYVIKSCFSFLTCMMMNSKTRGSLVMSPAGRSKRNGAFQTGFGPLTPLVSLVQMTFPSCRRLMTT